MAEEKKTVEFHEVTPIGRRKMDPYSGVFVAPGDTLILDAASARMFEEMGEVEIVTKNVTPPWVEPAPVAVKPVLVEATQAEKPKK